MLVLLRIVLGAALAYVVKLTYENSQSQAAAGLFDSVMYVGVVVVLALANGIVWAPYFGSRVADAMTGEGAASHLSEEEERRRQTPWRRFVRRMGWLTVLLLLAGASLLAWQYRSLYVPATDVYQAWRLGKVPLTAPEAEFTVINVLDGANLQGRNAAGETYTIRLAGLEAPSATSYDTELRERAKASREYLSSLLLSNSVQVEVTLTNASRVLLGIVRFNGTNVNAEALAAGHAQMKPEYFGNTSLRSRWAMLRAQHEAELNAQPDSAPSDDKEPADK